MAADPADSSPLLVIGVLSFHSPAALRKRQSMRSVVSATTTSRAQLRFVVDSPDEDSVYNDVLSFNVSSTTRPLGTYLLTNAFFRHVASSSEYAGTKFIGRSDDDSAFNATTLLTALLSIDAALLSSSSSSSGSSSNRHLVFGPLREWYIWNYHSMMPECWWPGPGLKLQVDRKVSSPDATTAFCSNKLARAKERGASLVGPYPFAKGPLAIFSRELVRDVLVPKLGPDEAWTLSAASASLRSRHGIIYDDIYYGALIYKALHERPLTLVDAPLSEYQKSKPKLDRRGRPKRTPPALHPRGAALIYHKLKHPKRFDLVRNASLLASPSATRDGTEWEASRLECVPLPDEFSAPRRKGWFAELVAEVHYKDCAAWRFCTYKELKYPTPPYYRAS